MQQIQFVLYIYSYIYYFNKIDHKSKIMKPIILSLLLISITSIVRSQGLNFDSVSFKQQQEFPLERAALPSRYSLEKYLPALYPQTGGTCVAMSVALARTIMFAKSTGTTDLTTITRNQMSPYFIYYYGRDKYDYDCSIGMNPIAALTVAKNIGFEKMSRIEYPKYWPYSNNFLCPNTYDFLPPETQLHLNNAKSYKINDFFVTKSIAGIKSALSKGFPVILAMQIPKSFQECKSLIWKSPTYENRSKASGHAMVAIGYDDAINSGSFRIANSWGTEWGDKGKIWINYSELEYWLDGAFIMVTPTGSTYRLDNLESLNNYKLPKSRTFKSSEFNGKVNFNNKEYIEIFSKDKLNQ